MSDTLIPHFHNGAGRASIRIGAEKFQCIGAPPPFDHPHIFLNMGKKKEIICPYCSTRYQHDPALSEYESDPPESYYVP
ncbi:MAG: zinc-finger domain-containing protein [Alphaproteobacteria bacterium]|nr:zinc-finger domain-containing protein [Alphaproteobacteria bacterium]